ncbi:tetratricopeptide repeat protein [candidate division TA06 bacterium]|nr:tetratricopeptide repeat protein [candidate division TA06 bacterium]
MSLLLSLLQGICLSNEHDADKLISCEIYREAITEYKRMIYLGDTTKGSDYIHYKIAICYSYLGKYDEAMSHMNNALSICNKDSLKDAIYFTMGLIYLKSDKPVNAEFEFINLANFTDNDSLAFKAKVFQSICLLKQNKFDKAMGILKSLGNDSLSMMIDSITPPQLGNSAKNKYLSALIPGFGQILGGSYGKGVNAFALNAFFMGTVYHSLYHKDYWELVLTTLPWAYRYYSGNIYQAGKIFDDNNIRTMEKYQSEILNIIATMPLY